MAPLAWDGKAGNRGKPPRGLRVRPEVPLDLGRREPPGRRNWSMLSAYALSSRGGGGPGGFGAVRFSGGRSHGHRFERTRSCHSHPASGSQAVRREPSSTS